MYEHATDDAEHSDTVSAQERGTITHQKGRQLQLKRCGRGHQSTRRSGGPQEEDAEAWAGLELVHMYTTQLSQVSQQTFHV